MPLTKAQCPNCGGALEVDASKEAAVCPFCNTPYIVEKAINNYVTNVTNNIKADTVVINSGPDKASLLKRAFMLMEDLKWDDALKYCEQCLDLDPENAEAYLYKTMIFFKVSEVGDLIVFPYQGNPDYEKFNRFASEDQIANFRQAIEMREKAMEHGKMVIDNVFSILGRGTVVTGKVENGSVAVNDPVKCNGKLYRVIRLEMYRMTIDRAKAGDDIGMYLEGANKSDFSRGDIITF